jgi:hypothetical protein
MMKKLERALGRFAIPHLVTFLVAGQAGAFVLSFFQPEFVGALALVPERVLAGEVWRLVTFLLIPPPGFPIFVVFALYMSLLFGRALEEEWGHFRFNVYIFVGWVASVGASFADRTGAATGIFLMNSVFLAFAYLNPNYELLLLGILPVKTKWLALVAVLASFYAASEGGVQAWALLGASFVNFALFFGADIVARLRSGRWRTARQREKRETASKAMHVCGVCGLTDLENPTMQFRYCSQCDKGSRAYCMDHIRDHEHVRAPEESPVSDA